MSALADEMGLSLCPTSDATRDEIAGSFARQLAGDDFATLLVDTQMELAIVPALLCSAQLAGVDSETAAVDQDVQRRLLLDLVEGDLTPSCAKTRPF